MRREQIAGKQGASEQEDVSREHVSMEQVSREQIAGKHGASEQEEGAGEKEQASMEEVSGSRSEGAGE